MIIISVATLHSGNCGANLYSHEVEIRAGQNKTTPLGRGIKTMLRNSSFSPSAYFFVIPTQCKDRVAERLACFSHRAIKNVA